VLIRMTVSGAGRVRPEEEKVLWCRKEYLRLIKLIVEKI
jgi:hypothetical protein